MLRKERLLSLLKGQWWYDESRGWGDALTMWRDADFVGRRRVPTTKFGMKTLMMRLEMKVINCRVLEESHMLFVFT
jgi:hypothetical protein